MRKVKERERGTGPPARRHVQFWKPFNDWWRSALEKSGKRPCGDDIIKWYQDNADAVWADEEHKPTTQDCRTHAKCLRTVDAVRDYFRKYREERRKPGGQGSRGNNASGEEDTEDMDVSESGSYQAEVNAPRRILPSLPEPHQPGTQGPRGWPAQAAGQMAGAGPSLMQQPKAPRQTQAMLLQQVQQHRQMFNQQQQQQQAAQMQQQQHGEQQQQEQQQAAQMQQHMQQQAREMLMQQQQRMVTALLQKHLNGQQEQQLPAVNVKEEARPAGKLHAQAAAPHHHREMSVLKPPLSAVSKGFAGKPAVSVPATQARGTAGAAAGKLAPQACAAAAARPASRVGEAAAGKPALQACTMAAATTAPKLCGEAPGMSAPHPFGAATGTPAPRACEAAAGTPATQLCGAAPDMPVPHPFGSAAAAAAGKPVPQVCEEAAAAPALRAGGPAHVEVTRPTASRASLLLHGDSMQLGMTLAQIRVRQPAGGPGGEAAPHIDPRGMTDCTPLGQLLDSMGDSPNSFFLNKLLSEQMPAFESGLCGVQPTPGLADWAAGLAQQHGPLTGLASTPWTASPQRTVDYHSQPYHSQPGSGCLSVGQPSSFQASLASQAQPQHRQHRLSRESPYPPHMMYPATYWQQGPPQGPPGTVVPMPYCYPLPVHPEEYAMYMEHVRYGAGAEQVTCMPAMGPPYGGMPTMGPQYGGMPAVGPQYGGMPALWPYCPGPEPGLPPPGLCSPGMPLPR